VALGAGRGRLIRLLLTESLLLSIGGAAAGIWLADGLSKFLVGSINVESNSLFLDLGLDWRLLGFSSLTGVVTCALFGLAPALGAARVAPDAILRAGGRGSTDPGGRRRFRQMLVVSQLALSFVLLAAALLFGRTLKNLMVQDLGMHIDGVTISYVDMSRLNLPLERRAVFKRTIMRQLEQTPGVISVAETSLVPLSGGASDNSVWVDETDATQRGVSFFMNTSAGYFKTMATPLLAGRRFDDDRDTPQSPLVAVVNEAFAWTFFAGNSPVGKRFWRDACWSWRWAARLAPWSMASNPTTRSRCWPLRSCWLWPHWAQASYPLAARPDSTPWPRFDSNSRGQSGDALGLRPKGSLSSQTDK
jgi:putative ABC transport system permease protein